MLHPHCHPKRSYPVPRRCRRCGKPATPIQKARGSQCRSSVLNGHKVCQTAVCPSPLRLRSQFQLPAATALSRVRKIRCPTCRIARAPPPTSSGASIAYQQRSAPDHTRYKTKLPPSLLADIAGACALPQQPSVGFARVEVPAVHSAHADLPDQRAGKRRHRTFVKRHHRPFGKHNHRPFVKRHHRLCFRIPGHDGRTVLVMCPVVVVHGEGTRLP